MTLAKYKTKRKFDKTPEPKGKVAKRKKQLTFVVQRHDASHLHYDFRLEADGVLKSWAVPKGPSLNPSDKRLAMMVEDHPVSYGTFEGVIPEGNYGAGFVDVWDHGTYEPVDEDSEVQTEKDFLGHLKKGSIKFRLKGRKLKGEFALVKMHGKGENSWLLIKHRDKYATDDTYDSEDYAKKSSLKKSAEKKAAKEAKKRPAKKATSKKATTKKAATKKAASKKKALTKSRYSPDKKINRKYSKYITPMMAKLYDKAFDDEAWTFEIKWDGYRAVAEIDNGAVKLYSRNGLSFEEKYPVIADALSKIRKEAVLDGEIVALNKDGMPSFQLLQHYDPDGDVALVYYVFDCLSIDGKSVQANTLRERKDLLKEVLSEDNSFIRYCEDIPGKGTDFFATVKNMGLEGMIAKKIKSKYRAGARSDEWLKVKQVQTEEAVIAGYTAPRGGRKYFGALVLGIYVKGKLTYIGHTGTGFDNRTLKELHELFKDYTTDDSPFDEKVPVNGKVTWLRPELVCNLKYSELTNDGLRRHPVFMGLRVDKESKEASNQQNVVSKKNVHEKKNKPENMDKERSIGGKKVSLTNLEKVFWPDEGYTKGDLIEYYEKIYKYISKYLKDRPQSLRRTPNGIKDDGFFHKDAGDNAPDWVDTYEVYSESADKDINYLVCNNKATLLYMANLGCIEINPWNSKISSPDNPDYIVMDIDPSEKNTFDQVVETAHVIRDILEKADCRCYCKTSGATGLHVYVPLAAKYNYDDARDFAHLIATLTHEKLPDFTSLERSLKKRGKDNIYIDYLQNRPGQTLSSVYSLRPKTGAPVSTPLTWDEVKPGMDPKDYNIKTIFKRLEKKGDLFSPVLGRGVDIIKAINKLGG